MHARRARCPRRTATVRQIYLREEDFLCDYLGTVEAVLPHLGGWQPNYGCNDREREARRLALARGTQAELVLEEERSEQRELASPIHWNSVRAALRARPFRA